MWLVSRIPGSPLALRLVHMHLLIGLGGKDARVWMYLIETLLLNGIGTWRIDFFGKFIRSNHWYFLGIFWNWFRRGMRVDRNISKKTALLKISVLNLKYLLFSQFNWKSYWFEKCWKNYGNKLKVSNLLSQKELKWGQNVTRIKIQLYLCHLEDAKHILSNTNFQLDILPH